MLAHLIGIIEDAVAGRISGPPSPEQTAEQVDRHRDDDPRELLATWEVGAPLFEPALTERGLWPAFFDVLSHELDIRSALGRPDERDNDDVHLAARLGAEGLPPQIEIDLDGSSRDEPLSDGHARLSASSFEVLRIRLGRRSRAQVLAMAWSGDPTPHLDALFVFGPRDTDLIE